jgi:hypothetical protein
MRSIFVTQMPAESRQFSLLALMEYVTICSILAALSSVLGIAASAILMFLALAIWAKAGRLAMGLLMALLLAVHAAPLPMFSFAQPLLGSLTALGIALWYQGSRQWAERSRQVSRPSTASPAVRSPS